MSLAGLVADLQRRGISPRQHFDTEWAVPKRIVTYSARVVQNPKQDPTHFGGPRIDDAELTYGDDHGWHLWPAKSRQARECSAWFAAAAPSVILDGGVVPLRGPDQADDRFVPRAQNTPSWATEFPGLWTGTAGRGSADYDQLHTWHPDFLGLVAPNKSGEGRYGTKVFDLDDSSRIDTQRWAHIQSLLSVVPLGAGGCGVSGDALAIQLGRSGQDGLSGGALFVEWEAAKPATRTKTRLSKPRKASKITAVGSARLGGGPFVVGPKGDQHTLGKDRDGDDIQSLHIDVNALWLGLEGDAPLAFTGDAWEEPEDPGPLMQRTYLRLNPGFGHAWCGGARKGKWEWETPTWFYVPEPPDPQPPPPDGDPPPFPPPPPQPPPPENPPPFQPPPPEDVLVLPWPGYELIGDPAPPKPNYAQMVNCLILAGGLVQRASAWAEGERDLTGTGTLTAADRALADAAPVVSVTRGFAPGVEGNGAWTDFETQQTGLRLPIPVAGAGDLYLPPDRSVRDAINDEDYEGAGVALYFPTKSSCLAFGNPNPAGSLQDGVTIEADGAGDLAIRVWAGGTNTDTYSTDDFGGSSTPTPGDDVNIYTTSNGATAVRKEHTETITDSSDAVGTAREATFSPAEGDEIVAVFSRVKVEPDGAGAAPGDTYSVGHAADFDRWGSSSNITAGTTTGASDFNIGSASARLRVQSSGYTLRVTPNGWSGWGAGEIEVTWIYEVFTNPTS